VPSRARRAEEDIRAGRFESTIGTADLKKLYSDGRLKQKVYMCGQCHTPYEEKSRVCPRCDKRTMGEIVPMRESEIELNRKKSLERIRAKYI
jgi:rubrerythrin